MQNIIALREAIEQANETLEYKALVVTDVKGKVTITEHDENGIPTNNVSSFEGNLAFKNALCSSTDWDSETKGHPLITADNDK